MASQKPRITRAKHDGRVYSWEMDHSDWGGHSSFVHIEAFQVVVGDRYAEEGHTSRFECHPADFVGGCFHALIKASFGDAALSEMIAEVEARGDALAVFEAPPRPEAAWKPVRPAFAPGAPTPKRARKTAAKAVSRPAAKAAAKPAAKPVEAKPPTKRKAARKKKASVSAPKPAEGNVNIAVTGCRKVDLALVSALKGLTGQSASEVKGNLQNLPLLIKTNVTFAEGRAIQRRLGGLGATVSLAG